MQFKSWLKNENDRVLAMGMCFPFAYEKAKEWFDAHIKHPDLNNKDKFKVVHGTITDKWEKPPKSVVMVGLKWAIWSLMTRQNIPSLMEFQKNFIMIIISLNPRKSLLPWKL